MNVLRRNKKVFIALFLVFIAPGIFAVMFYMHPSWLGGLPTNKGLLIRPSVPLNALSDLSKAEKKDKWHMVVWCPKGCHPSCLDDLDAMARVRLALGRRLYQVNLWMLQPKQSLLCTLDVTAALEAGGIKLQALPTGETAEVLEVLTEEPKIFLADPEHYLVLEYPSSGKPESVFQDLRRLLNTREQA